MDGAVQEAQGHGLRPAVRDHVSGPGEDRVVLAGVPFVGDQHVRESIHGRIDTFGVDHQAGEVVVEDRRPQAGARARPRHVVEGRLQRTVAPRPGIERDAGGGHAGQRDEDGHRRHELVEAQPRAAQRHHLGVGRESSEGDQDGEQHRHGDGDLEERRHDVGEESQDAREREAAAHHQLDQLEQPGDEQHEREDGEAEGEREDDLPEDVSVEDPGNRARVAG